MIRIIVIDIRIIILMMKIIINAMIKNDNDNHKNN